jgi:osmotically-inducible protein OsmY
LIQCFLDEEKNMMKKLLVPILIPFVLSGCVAAVVASGAAGGAAATSVIYDKRSVTTISNDDKLASLIQQRLDANEILSKKCRLVVTAYNDWVILLGEAPTDELKQEALDTIKTTAGIKRLYDEIQIQAPIGLGQQTKDAWITTQAKSVLLATKGLNSVGIKIITENGVVYLVGLISPEQARIAVNALKDVSDIQEIVKIFDYTTTSTHSGSASVRDADQSF